VRIVQLANFYTPVSGGLRTCLEQTAAGYVSAGHERVLLVPGLADRDEQTAVGRRLTVQSPRLPGSGGYRVLTQRTRVCALLDDVRPDILEVSDKLSIGWLARWARRRGVPLVLFSHERIDAILRSRVPGFVPLSAAANVVNRRLAGLVDQIVVTSRFSAAEFERVGAHHVARVPLGVDLTTFRPAPAAAVDAAPVRLVTVSRLSREKRPELAVDALRVLADSGIDAHLVVVGDGPLQDRLRQRAAGLPVTFTGHVSDRRRLAALVSTADVALSPSPAETFGLATLEALACGVPAVVPAQGAAAELVTDPGSGRVTDGTPDGLADGVRSLLALPAAHRRSAARAAAQRYPWSATVAGLVSLYRTLVADRRPPRPLPAPAGS
jgi:alpha-1,6-mannosyltransferase